MKKNYHTFGYLAFLLWCCLWRSVPVWAQEPRRAPSAPLPEITPAVAGDMAGEMVKVNTTLVRIGFVPATAVLERPFPTTFTVREDDTDMAFTLDTPDTAPLSWVVILDLGHDNQRWKYHSLRRFLPKLPAAVKGAAPTYIVARQCHIRKLA